MTSPLAQQASRMHNSPGLGTFSTISSSPATGSLAAVPRSSMSPAAAQHLRGIQPTTDPPPPPLCETLVLPAVESRFAVPLKALKQLTADSTIDIVAVSGKPLLLMSITGGNRL